MSEIFVSVIICTYNRHNCLEYCLKSIKRQNYQNYEIIVVNGPSTDDTKNLLKKIKDIIVIQQNFLDGISAARNSGISAARGDIIAFIDDDAVADINWLKSLVDGYGDASVGGVGGVVYEPGKSTIQFENGVINKSGISFAVRSLNSPPKKNQFPHCIGTNCSFKKNILYQVGGFDPYFRYHLEESDLCVRIIQAGFTIIYQKKAIVIHYSAEGYNRISPDNLNSYEIYKNCMYFILKNFRDDVLSYTFRPLFALIWWGLYFLVSYIIHKKISFKQLMRIYFHGIRGAIQGYKDGFQKLIADKRDNSSHR
jgi:GT2 family glycosyltransferase